MEAKHLDADQIYPVGAIITSIISHIYIGTKLGRTKA
jgi:hypothetical protein